MTVLGVIDALLCVVDLLVVCVIVYIWYNWYNYYAAITMPAAAAAET